MDASCLIFASPSEICDLYQPRIMIAMNTKNSLLISIMNNLNTCSLSDMQKAKEFYSKTLSFDISEMNGLLSLHIGNGAKVLIYPKSRYLQFLASFLMRLNLSPYELLLALSLFLFPDQIVSS